jgi:hypothetical protein
MADTNPLALMTPAELHGGGLEYLHRARQLFEEAPSPAAAASIGICQFFASMSAENLAAEAGAHRTDEKTPPHGTPAAAPAGEYSGNHG